MKRRHHRFEPAIYLSLVRDRAVLKMNVRSLLKQSGGGAYLVGVTTDKRSSLGQLVDLPIELAASTKQDSENVRSYQVRITKKLEVPCER